MKKLNFFIRTGIFFVFICSLFLSKGVCQNLNSLEGITESLFKKNLTFSVYEDDKTPAHVKKMIKMTTAAYQNFPKEISPDKAEEVKKLLFTELAKDPKNSIRGEYNSQIYQLWLYSIVEYLAGYGIYAEVNGALMKNGEYLPWVTFYQVTRIDPHQVKIWQKDYLIDVVVVSPELNIDGQTIAQAVTDQMSTLAITTSNRIIIKENVLLNTMNDTARQKQIGGSLPQGEIDKLFINAPYQDLEQIIQGVIFINADPAALYDETIFHELGHLKDWRDQVLMAEFDKMDDLSKNTHAEINAFLSEFRHTPYPWYALQIMAYCLVHKEHDSPHCYAVNYIFDKVAEIIMKDPDRYGYRQLRPDINPRWQLMYQLPQILKDEKKKAQIFDAIYEKHQKSDLSLVFSSEWLDKICAKSNPTDIPQPDPVVFAAIVLLIFIGLGVIACLYFWLSRSKIDKKMRKKNRKKQK